MIVYHFSLHKVPCQKVSSNWNVQFLGKTFPKRLVFKCDLNIASDSDCLMFAGNAFQIVGATALKALPPAVLRK